ncbi:hypothetical protein RO3G_09835 [Rhizopus delemar RA 99-880]|uniref:F-box domain-containing protein n=1 Tax=Rhizopus delemar (strain RA 99-880 / ATCC MYA-4621 / FGSC 9543 / NRRL 43880) TaxID=246409 RepID=I1C9J5_RHIO9|nr:hypothetical protein RO3G_09835 [Rhizopus delemar RA 99-880]|eukprot:EIE85125.1 hypothetical protein RO3G_09835 [Rhizopus delemar RA 99-880]
MNNTPHLALKLPEIVSQIVSYLVNPSYQDQDKSTLYKDIYPCLFVNSLWHDCAFRYMWRSILFEDNLYQLQQMPRQSRRVIYKMNTLNGRRCSLIDIMMQIPFLP